VFLARRNGGCTSLQMLEAIALPDDVRCLLIYTKIILWSTRANQGSLGAA